MFVVFRQGEPQAHFPFSNIPDKKSVKFFLYKIWPKKRVRKPIIEEIKIGNTYYYLLTAYPHKGKINWQTVYKAAGIEAPRLLLPENITPPRNCKIGRFEGERYRKKLLINAFLSVIKQTNPASLRLVLADKDGKYADVAIAMLRKAASVYVITHNPQRYDFANQRAMELFGARIILTDETSFTANCSAILAPDGICGLGTVALPDIFFNGDADSLNGYTIQSDCLTLPRPYEDGIPANIDRLTFAAALYERSGLRYFRGLLPDFAKQGGKLIPISQIADNISQRFPS